MTWKARSLSWTLDGRTVATIRGAHIPADRMELDIQTETNTNCSIHDYTCINATTPRRVALDVDWVVAYAPR